MEIFCCSFIAKAWLPYGEVMCCTVFTCHKGKGQLNSRARIHIRSKSNPNVVASKLLILGEKLTGKKTIISSLLLQSNLQCFLMKNILQRNEC